MTRVMAAVVAGMLAAAGAVVAEDIPVKPGTGTISAAAGVAEAWDVLVLEPGEYTDEVKLPAGVSLRGPGADKATLTGLRYAVISALGANVTISGIEVRGSAEKTTRGVAAEQPVRVERVRFVELKEAVSLLGAPLSDVVACEFIKCGIGVRAVGDSSPTVWGCLFVEGNIGVFAMGGEPYVRDNVFTRTNAGLRLISDNSAIVRNNVFDRCGAAGIQAEGRRGAAIFAPSVRNNVFVSCGAAMVSAKLDPQMGLVSHNAVHASGESPMTTPEGGASMDPAAMHFVMIDPGLDVKDSGEVSFAKDGELRGKGIRLASEPEGTKGDIALSAGVTRVGVGYDEKLLPPVRFVGPVHIANGVSEEYLYFRTIGVRPSGQSLRTVGGVRQDVHKTPNGEVAFDLSRFFGEMGLKP